MYLTMVPLRRRHTSTCSSASTSGSMGWAEERFHVLILGSHRVGKTAFIQQLIHSSFKEAVDVELEIMEETVTVKCLVDQNSYTVDVTDTAYQQDDNSPVLTEQLYSLTNGCVLMYSVADRDSFSRIQLIYSHLLAVKGRSHCPCVLVGNKMDCPGAFRQVPRKDGEAMAEMMNIPFIEVTCKTRTGVERSVQELIRELRDPHPEDDSLEPDAWRGSSSLSRHERKRSKQRSCAIS